MEKRQQRRRRNKYITPINRNLRAHSHTYARAGGRPSFIIRLSRDTNKNRRERVERKCMQMSRHALERSTVCVRQWVFTISNYDLFICFAWAWFTDGTCIAGTDAIPWFLPTAIKNIIRRNSPGNCDFTSLSRTSKLLVFTILITASRGNSISQGNMI